MGLHFGMGSRIYTEKISSRLRWYDLTPLDMKSATECNPNTYSFMAYTVMPVTSGVVTSKRCVLEGLDEVMQSHNIPFFGSTVPQLGMDTMRERVRSAGRTIFAWA